MENKTIYQTDELHELQNKKNTMKNDAERKRWMAKEKEIEAENQILILNVK